MTPLIPWKTTSNLITTAALFTSLSSGWGIQRPGLAKARFHPHHIKDEQVKFDMAVISLPEKWSLDHSAERWPLGDHQQEAEWPTHLNIFQRQSHTPWMPWAEAFRAPPWDAGGLTPRSQGWSVFSLSLSAALAQQPEDHVMRGWLWWPAGCGDDMLEVYPTGLEGSLFFLFFFLQPLLSSLRIMLWEDDYDDLRAVAMKAVKLCHLPGVPAKVLHHPWDGLRHIIRPAHHHQGLAADGEAEEDGAAAERAAILRLGSKILCRLSKQDHGLSDGGLSESSIAPSPLRPVSLLRGLGLKMRALQWSCLDHYCTNCEWLKTAMLVNPPLAHRLLYIWCFITIIASIRCECPKPE